MPELSVDVLQLQAPIPYLERPVGGEELYNYAYEPPKGVPVSNGKAIDHSVSICDIRSVRDKTPFTLQKQGFKLVDFPAGRSVTDWADELQVRVYAIYIHATSRIPLEMESLLVLANWPYANTQVYIRILSTRAQASLCCLAS